MRYCHFGVSPVNYSDSDSLGGGSNEYPQSICFKAKIRKNVYPRKPQFYYIKVGCKGVFVTRTCFRDVIQNDVLLTFSVPLLWCGQL